jgi:hypothetical protein
MVVRIHVNKAALPNVKSSGTAAGRDVEWNNDKQISQINRNWQGQRLASGLPCASRVS